MPFLQEVVIQDVADFFVDHAISDNLGIIANAHLAMADQAVDVSCSHRSSVVMRSNFCTRGDQHYGEKVRQLSDSPWKLNWLLDSHHDHKA